MQHVTVVALVDPAQGAGVFLDGRAIAVEAADLPGGAAAVPAHATHVFLVGERRHEALVRRQAAAIADRGPVVAWRALPHGPAAIALIAAQAGSAGAGATDAGIVAAFVDVLAEQAWSGAWMPTVARLEHPAPSVGQHLRSWAPSGIGFVATFSGPAPQVQAAGAATLPAEPALARGPVYCTGLDGIPEPARAALMALSGGTHLVDMPDLQISPAGRTGSERAVEAVAFPALEHLSVRTSTGPCPSCGAAVAAAFCTYCHVRRATGAAQRGAVE
ncbi:hypothetical protein ACTHAM_000249 [Cellulomonas soli]|uniref:hypothetical protein n=1 Tax=Cellulomonas soli TaxID=931535 RepID=UPI003F83BECD